MEWSPPSTSGTSPASSVFSTSSACLVQVSVISFRYLAFGSPSVFCLGDSDGDVAAVLDVVAEGFEAGFESGDAHGRGAHVDAAAGLAQVERHADHANVARYECPP